jgi:hypothetical protein
MVQGYDISNTLRDAEYLSKQEAVRFEIEMFQIELLDVKGERREQSMKAYRKLVKLQNRPVHSARTDE